MTIRHFYIFKAVCEEMSFTRAAAKLYMTQPAVSHAVRELEKETGAVLFERLAKKIYLTRDGERFFEKTVRLLEQYESMKELGREKEEEPFRLGSGITVANSWLPELLKTWRDIPVQVEVDSLARMLEKVKNNQVDMAFLEGVFDSSGLVCIPFLSYRVLAVCGADYPLEEEIPAEELVLQPLLLREKGSAVRDVFDSALFLLGLAARPAWVSVNSQALLRAAESGLGVALLPESILRESLNRGSLREVKVQELELKNQSSLVYRRDKFLTEPMKRLTERIRLV